MTNFDNSPAAQNIAIAAPQKKLSMNVIVSMVLLTALMGTTSFIYWNKIITKERMMVKDSQYAESLTRRDSLQSLLNNATMRYDLLKTTVVNKDLAITNQEKEISKIRTMIESLLTVVNASQSQHLEIKRLIQSLNKDIEGYKNQVETLKGQNKQLATAYEAVISEEEKNKSIKAAEAIQPVAAENAEAAEIGSTLFATNFANMGVIEKKNGKERLSDAARKVNKLRVTFDLAENRNSITGPKEIYVAITAPDGSPVSLEAPGSVKFSGKDGKGNFYTHKIIANYVKGQRQKISFDWAQDEKFVTGVYKIEVFNNGFKIGEGFKAFKKCGVFD